jgi:hypothetical protein
MIIGIQMKILETLAEIQYITKFWCKIEKEKINLTNGHKRMKVQFDWEMAQKIEMELRKSSDIEGLLKINLEFLESIRAGFMLEKRFPKICYFYGRLKRTGDLTLFINRFSGEIQLFINKQLLEISELLHNIGLRFPHLSEDDLIQLENAYKNPVYFDLIEDILFDQHLLVRPLQKYDASSRQVRHVSFSTELKLSLFNGYLHNTDMIFDNYENGEFYYFYNRNKNLIVRKESMHNFETKVEFHIDFSDLDVVNFSEYVKKFLGNDFFEFYRKDPYNNNQSIEIVGDYTFDNDAYREYQKRILLFPEKISPELLTIVEENIANNWLLEINR